MCRGCAGADVRGMMCRGWWTRRGCAGTLSLSVVLQAPRPVASRGAGRGRPRVVTPLGRCSEPRSTECGGTLFLRGAVHKCYGPGSIFACCCNGSSLSLLIFLAALFYTRAKPRAWPGGCITTLSSGCLGLQGAFPTLSFSSAQHSICRCFWELILTVCFSLGHVLVLQSTSLQGL